MHLKTIIKLPAMPNIQAVRILEQAEASIYLSVDLLSVPVPKTMSVDEDAWKNDASM